MPIPDINAFRSEVARLDGRWEVLDLNLSDEIRRHGLGALDPTPEEEARAVEQAQTLLERRPELAAGLSLSERSGVLDQDGDGELEGTSEGAGGRPRTFDWRSHGVVGPVTDQLSCGACVSFAWVGLVSCMASIELGQRAPDLSEADLHFSPAHGASCRGWTAANAIDTVRLRGIVRESEFPYAAAFDKPPIFAKDAKGKQTDVWVAHAKEVSDRDRTAVRITHYTGWPHDFPASGGFLSTLNPNTAAEEARKNYLSQVGPLVASFSVFEDFFLYGGGVYHHVKGDYVGGHCVLVVGYDDDAGAWVCRNSWGPGWGGPARADGTGGGFFRIAYGDSDINLKMMWGATGVVAPALGWSWWRTVNDGVALPNTSIASAGRASDKLDIFCVGTDQGVYTAAWEASDDAWRGWWRLGALFAAPGSSVAAVSSAPDQLDVFALGTDRRVFSSRWDPSMTGWAPWQSVAGGVAAPNTSVTAVSRTQGSLDVFCVGTDHRVYHSWSQPALPWAQWDGVAGGVAAPNTSITAVHSVPLDLHVFCVGTDHRIYHTWWEPGRPWAAWEVVAGGVAAANTSIAAVSRDAHKLDLFCVGTDRRIYTAAWEPGDTSWRGWWRVGDLRAAPDTSPSAVVRDTNKLDVFAVSEDGHRVSVASWEPGYSGWYAWRALSGGRTAPGTSVDAVSRRFNRMDAFVVGTDHRVYAAAWPR